MNFFHLTNPLYASDQARKRANPLRTINGYWIPGLTCSKCGETWAGTRRLYLPLNDLSIIKFLNLPPLSDSDWYQNLSEIRRILRLPESFELQPGDRLGIPEFELHRTKIGKIMFAFPGQIIVTKDIVDDLKEAGVSGYSPIQAIVKWSDSVKEAINPPALYELMIHGHAWRKDMSIETSIACDKCRRPLFHNPNVITVDEDRWDGSDMFNLDLNPHKVIVTQKVCEVLLGHKNSNYVCQSL